jgi:hypothetical protein
MQAVARAEVWATCQANFTAGESGEAAFQAVFTVEDWSVAAGQSNLI